MPRVGFIHDKLDIKFLVLYILSRTEAPINFAILTDLSLCDVGVDYFLFSQAVSELVESEHVLLEHDLYCITDKGRKNGAICEESLPYSIRKKCDRNISQLNAKLRLEAQIRTEVTPRENGGFTVRLILDDNSDNLVTIDLYSPTREQADRFSDSFRNAPDYVYRSLLSSLTESERSKE